MLAARNGCGVLAAGCWLLALLAAAPQPACGATRCDTPLRWAADTAAGLAQAQEKFLSCAQAQPSALRPERWKKPSEAQAKTPAEPQGGSRLKRPSDVGNIIRSRRNDAMRTPISSSSAGGGSRSAGESTPARSAMRDDGTTPRLHTVFTDGSLPQGRQERLPLAWGDTMQDSPMLFSSTRSDSVQRDSMSAQATPACYSQTRHTSVGSLGQSALKAAGEDTPHLRASDWPEDTPDRIVPQGSLSQKLFAEDGAQLPVPAQSLSSGNLYSAVKAAQQRREEVLKNEGLMSAAAATGMSEYEEEACMLLSTARIELQSLNDRWKEAEEARLQQSKVAEDLRKEVDILHQDAEVLEAEKVTIYNELQASQRLSAGLQDELSAVQQQHREVNQRCSALMAEKVAAEAHVASLESKTLSLQQRTTQQDSSLELDEHKQKLRAMVSQLVSVQDERQKLWAHLADMQLSASDAEQIHVSQRQQLKALCSALEASELQREQLEAKALRAEERCDELLSSSSNATTLSAARERELEELLTQANQKEHASFVELEALVIKCQDLEAQLEVQVRACTEGEQLRFSLQDQIQEADSKKKEADQRVESLLKAHEVAGRSFEEELDTWRARVQELESELNRVQEQRLSQIAAAAESEERVRACELRLQQEADEKVLRAQEAGAADLESLKTDMHSQRELWECQVAEATLAVQAAAAKIAEKEREAASRDQTMQQLEGELSAARQHLCDSLQRQEELKQLLVAAEQRHEQQTAAGDEQATRLRSQQQRCSELEAQVTELEDAKVRLEHQCKEGLATIAVQTQVVQRKEALEEENAQLQIELAGMVEEKTKLERDAQAKLSGSKDLEAKLDAAAAESAALVRRCEELRVAYETASAGKQALEQQVAAQQSEAAQLREDAARIESDALSRIHNLTCSAEALAMRAREVEASCQQHEEHAQGQAHRICELEGKCKDAQAREAEAQQRCKEAEKVAREATRSASKELYLVQAQASHLRQQVDALTKEKEAALRERDEATKERHALNAANKQRQDEVARLSEQLRSLQVQQHSDDDGRGGERARGGRVQASGGWSQEAGAGGLEEGEDVLESVIAQRTRRR